jgi:hypothetical protein
MRTDENNNPAAFTCNIAEQAGLVEGADYEQGDPFSVPAPGGMRTLYYTAKLLGDPIALTIRVIDAIGYYTKGGTPRWIYIALPKFVLDALTPDQKRDVIGYHYEREGGVTMRSLFPNYGIL